MTTTADESIPDRIPSYDELVAFDLDEFATAFQWAMNAASGEAHVRDPQSLRFSLLEEDGELMNYQFADRPAIRIILAMMERYRSVDPVKYHSVVARIFALIDIVRQGGLEPWIRVVPGEDGYSEIADSVIAAAAVVKLNSKLCFPVREFMREVRQIEASKEE